MTQFVDWLLATGRPGGAFALALGLLCFGLTILDFEANRGFFLMLPVFGLILVIFGGVLLVHGNPQSGDFNPKEAAPPSPELLDALHNTARPFYFCTRCRTIGEVGLCPRCKKGLDCVEIRDDEDLRLALVALT